jgi:hypothetical protein
VICEYEGKTVEAMTLNVSRAGLLLEGPDLPPVGKTLKVRINLSHEIELVCEVRHVVFGCGVRVLSMNPEQELIWYSYLDRMAAAIAQTFSRQDP